MSEEQPLEDPYAGVKQRMKWMWSLGDYGEQATLLEPHAEALADACDVRRGMSVLDVAAGNGNFAIAAARRAAVVTAVDLTPTMVALGRARTVREGLRIDWREGDAEDLPVADGAHQLVASIFGAMFAPRPERVVAELWRVTAPGGRIAMANWSSDGFLYRISKLSSSYVPAPQIELVSPFRWGDPDVLRERFAGLTTDIEIRRHTAVFEFDSARAAFDYWECTNGPHVALRTVVPAADYARLRGEYLELIAELNSARGSVRLEAPYIVAIARKP